ncbi:LysR family transcriptional regulator [Ideonella sp.]|uniref:LysR family transcriptional regulator n=1 Tax=Ideonella sp. TaxID=1929293 RepID=UPI003BB5E0E6
MRFHGLDLNLLVALNALLTERNISRAAERVCLSQPAMSNALARLRDYFNDELLSTVGRQLVLTPRAEALLEPVREVLMRIESTISARWSFDPATEARSFNIQLSDYSATVFLPALIQRLSKEAPKVRLNLLPVDGRQSDVIEQGEVDLLIMPSQYVLAQHPTTPLFEERYVCVTWDEHPEIRTELTVEAYLAAGHVIAHFGAKAPVFEGWFFERYGVSRRIEITAPTLSSLPRFVVGTPRLATVHRRVALECQKSLPIKIWELPFEMPKLVQTMQWHRHRTNDASLSWLRQCAEEVGRAI